MPDKQGEDGARLPSEVSAELHDGLVRCRKVVDVFRQRLTRSETGGQDNDEPFEEEPGSQQRG